MNENMEWDNLGNAIVEQAHEDYLEALLLEHKAILMLGKAAADGYGAQCLRAGHR